MTKEWIEPIYDRTYGDVLSAQNNPDQLTPKGCWNAVDLNRIENNVVYCAEYMYDMKIVRDQIDIQRVEDNYWQENMIPQQSDIARICNNVRLLISYSMRNPAIADQLPNIYASTQINYVLANQLEFALDLMHNQPKLPLDYWNVTITNGIIDKVLRVNGTEEIINASSALVAEDEYVYIRGVPYGENAQYQIFSMWSGAANDLGLLEPNSTSQSVQFKMPYRAVSLTANFETHIPRTLTLTNAYISTNGDTTATSGPSTGTYYAGDRVMIIANVAEDQKKFYEWLGTEAGLRNIEGTTAAEDGAVSWLTMPDEDVSLYPHYINAGMHNVSISTSGNGTVSGAGQYNYNDTVYISATPSTHYQFVNWSGSYTSYLSNTTSSYQSFKMRDENISFRANFAYQYYNVNVQVIGGYIKINNQNVTSGTVTESNSYTLIADPPDNSYGIYNWTVEGKGSASRTSFTAGDENAILTANYRKYRTLTINNINNGGGTGTKRAVQGDYWGNVSTNSVVNTNYKFKGWYENNTLISSSTSINLQAGDTDRTIEARYDYYPTYTITVINRQGTGTTETYYRVSGDSISVSAIEEVGDTLFNGWTGDKTSSSTYISWTVTGDATITATYRAKETYTLTVNDGTGSGTYKERQWVSITRNEPAEGYYFSSWSQTGLRSINSYYSATTSVQIGRSDATVTANYASIIPTRAIQIVRNNGTLNYTVQQNSYSPYFDYGTAPTGKRFKRWVLTSGDATIGNTTSSTTRVRANNQDSVITCEYEDIPTYHVIMIDGYVQNDSGNWVTEADIRTGNTNAIKLEQGAVPLYHQFSMWEVYDENNNIQTNANDVAAPYAETTRLTGISRNITIKATFYQPASSIKYHLNIHRVDGRVDTSEHSAGEDVSITASTPPTGKEFLYWTGDTSTIGGGVSNASSWLRMPARDVNITEEYVDEGYIPTYELVMDGTYGECAYTTETTDPETGEITVTKHWVTRHNYPRYEEVEIRAVNIEDQNYFAGWSAAEYETGVDATSIITDTTTSTSTVIMPNYDVSVTPSVIPKQTYLLTVVNGYTGGQESAYYYEGARADIYFRYVDTADTHYQFIRWTGPDVSKLNLWDGGAFSVTTPGTVNSPQYIKTLGKAVAITGTYNTLYRTTITNGTIVGTGTNEGFYANNTTLNIAANTAPEGMTFRYWEGDIDHLSSIYDPTPTLTTTIGKTDIRPVYSNISDTNAIGYVNYSLKSSNTVDLTTITVIAPSTGNIETGFIITDSLGHIYVITAINNGIGTIVRLTRIVEGGNIYG